MIKIQFGQQANEYQIVKRDRKEENIIQIHRKKEQLEKYHNEKMIAKIKTINELSRRYKYIDLEMADGGIWQQEVIHVAIMFQNYQISLKKKIDKTMDSIILTNHGLDTMCGLLEQKENNRQALLRKIATNPYLKNLQEKQIDIIYAVAEPLVRIKGQTTVPILRDRINLYDHDYKIQEQSYRENNIAIRVSTERVFATKTKLNELIYGEEVKSKAMKIIQLFCDVVSNDKQILVRLENEVRLGEQQLVPIESIISRDQQTNIDLLIIVGNGAYLLKQIPHRFPIILINTHYFNHDNQCSEFLKQFYRWLFRRTSIKTSFEEAISKFKQNTSNNKGIGSSNAISKVFKFNCCCVHPHLSECQWGRIIDMVGIPVAHRIFMHQYASMGSQSYLRTVCTLQKAIIQSANCAKTVEVCCNNPSNNQSSHNSSENKFIPKLLIESNTLEAIEDHHNHSTYYRGLKKQEIQTNIRQTLLYRIVKAILQSLENSKQQNKCILEIVGGKNMGKHRLTTNACNYIYQRNQHKFNFKSVELKNVELKNDEFLEDEVKKVRKQCKLNHHNVIVIPNPPQDLNKFINDLEAKKQKQMNVVFILIHTRHHTQDNYFEFPKLNKNQILYSMIKKFSNRFVRDVRSSDFIYVNNLSYNINSMMDRECSFEQFSQFTISMYIQRISESQSELTNTSIDHIKQLKQLGADFEVRLKRIKDQQQILWRFLLFMSNFQEGIHLNDTNITILRLAGIYDNEIENEMKKNRQERKDKLLFYVKDREQKKLLVPQAYLLSYHNKVKEESQKIMEDYFKVLFIFAKKLRNVDNSQLWDQGIFSIKIPSYQNTQIDKNIELIDQKINDMSKKQQIITDHLKVISKIVKYHYSELISIVNMQNTQNQASVAFLVDIAALISYFNPRQKIQQKINKQLLLKCKSINKNQQWGKIAVIKIQTALQAFSFPNNIIQQTNENRKDKIIQYLQKYQQYRVQIIKVKLQIKQRSQMSLENVQKLDSYLIQCKKCLDEVINIISQKIQFGLDKDKLQILTMKLLLERTLNYFKSKNKYENNLNIINHKSLIQSIQKYKENIHDNKLINNHSTLKNDVKLCLVFLNDNITVSQVQQLNQKLINPRFDKILRFLKQKNNQKALFNIENGFIYMKSRNLFFNKKPHLIIRRKLPITSYIKQILKEYNVNVGFFNLTFDNLRMIKDSKIILLVLTTDCWDTKQSLEVILQDEYQVSQKKIKAKQFIQEISKLQIKYLLICGLNSKILTQKIIAQKDKSKLKINYIIYLDNSLNLTLKTGTNFIQSQVNQKIKDYILSQEYHRFIDLFVIELTENIINFQKSKQLKFNKPLDLFIDDIKKRIINIMKNSKWIYFQQIIRGIQIDVKNQFAQQQINYKLKEQDFKYLNSKIFEIKNNLKDTQINNSQFYQTVGRHVQLDNSINIIIQTINCRRPNQVINQIINFPLRQNSMWNGIIIQGERFSGKSCFLEELCWISLIKKFFKIGVYLIKMNELYKKKQSIISYFQQKAQEVIKYLKLQKVSSNNYMMIAIDDLKIIDYDQNWQFFRKIQSKNIFLVCTSDQKIQKKIQRKKSYKKISLNQFTQVEIFNLILSCLIQKKDLTSLQSSLKDYSRFYTNNSSFSSSQLLNYLKQQKILEVKDIINKNDFDSSIIDTQKLALTIKKSSLSN